MAAEGFYAGFDPYGAGFKIWANGRYYVTRFASFDERPHLDESHLRDADADTEGTSEGQTAGVPLQVETDAPDEQEPSRAEIRAHAARMHGLMQAAQQRIMGGQATNSDESEVPAPQQASQQAATSGTPPQRSEGASRTERCGPGPDSSAEPRDAPPQGSAEGVEASSRRGPPRKPVSRRRRRAASTTRRQRRGATGGEERTSASALVVLHPQGRVEAR